MIAFFGGSFDPVHNGHLILAEDVRELFKFERIIFIPAYVSPLKRTHYAEPADRIFMLERSIFGLKHFDIDRWEVDKGGISYTADTIEYLWRKYNQKPYLLLGADSLLNFKRWKDPDRVLKRSFIICMEREGKLKEVRNYLKENFPYFREGKDYFLVNTRRIDISSTEIRKRVKSGRSIRGMVPYEVEIYIKEKGIYI